MTISAAAKYLVYSIASGEILRKITCVPEALAMQVRAGEATIEVQDDLPYDDGSWIVAGGILGEVPGRPSPRHCYDFAAQSWIDPTAPLPPSARQSIMAIEANTSRALREAMLAYIAGDPVPAPAAARLTDAEAAIAALRAQL